jgi:hypothetical protein
MKRRMQRIGHRDVRRIVDNALADGEDHAGILGVECRRIGGGERRERSVELRG